MFRFASFKDNNTLTDVEIKVNIALQLHENGKTTYKFELYVLVRGSDDVDDVFSKFVLQRTSYTYEEIKFNRKFVPMYRESADGETTIVELQKMDEHVVVERV